MRSVALSPQAREAALEAMASTELDVLVVGGGVVGAGAALDAATRGLTVGLVEARDFASGTSSRSSKLIHGGLRYLEMLDFRLVAEALSERGLLIASRLNSAQPALGQGYELDAIAAVVIGGTSLSGGRGTVLGTLIGALIMSVLLNGLRILSVAQEWQTVVTGSIIILAVYIDMLRRRKL